MNNSDLHAFPLKDGNRIQNGLTKREIFAGLAMLGIIAHRGDDLYVAADAWNQADLLLKGQEK